MVASALLYLRPFQFWVASREYLFCSGATKTPSNLAARFCLSQIPTPLSTVFLLPSWVSLPSVALREYVLEAPCGNLLAVISHVLDTAQNVFLLYVGK